MDVWICDWIFIYWVFWCWWWCIKFCFRRVRTRIRRVTSSLWFFVYDLLFWSVDWEIKRRVFLIVFFWNIVVNFLLCLFVCMKCFSIYSGGFCVTSRIVRVRICLFCFVFLFWVLIFLEIFLLVVWVFFWIYIWCLWSVFLDFLCCRCRFVSRKIFCSVRVSWFFMVLWVCNSIYCLMDYSVCVDENVFFVVCLFWCLMCLWMRVFVLLLLCC